MKNIHILLMFALISQFCISQVTIGIDSVNKLSSDESIKDCTYCEEVQQYEITFYIENKEDDIAGFQFSLEPSELFDFTKESISKGEAENAGFTIYAGKGTILGFSMVGNVIAKNENRQMFFKLRTTLLDLNQYLESEINLTNLVLASKKGETLSSEFVPYSISNIK